MENNKSTYIMDFYFVAPKKFLNFREAQEPARIPPQTPPAGGTEAEAGRIHIPSQLFRPAESEFLSKKVRANARITPPKETSAENEERVAVREADGSLPEMKSAFACAVNSKSSPQLHERTQTKIFSLREEINRG